MLSKKLMLSRKLTMFLEGLLLLQPLHLGINSIYYTMRRFNIPDTSADLYITKINISIQLGYFIGLLLVNLYFYIASRSIQKFNNYFSVLTNWCTVVSSILLLFSYVVKGKEGSLLFYYYMLTISAFIFGFNQGLVMNVGVADIHWFTASIPTAGLEVVLFQLTFNNISRKIGHEKVDFTLIVCQITTIIFISALSSILWMFSYLGFKNSEYDIDECDLEADKYFEPLTMSFLYRVWMTKYPFICSAVGLGLVYGFYPAIVPYKLTSLDTAYYTDLTIISGSCILSILLCLLCEYTNLGPNKNWKNTRSLWVYSLLLIIPFLILPVFFVAPLHYPEVSIFNFVLKNKYFMAFLGITFTMIHSWLTTVGYAAAPNQTNKNYDRDMPPLNSFISYVVMIFVIIYSQGYLTLYTNVKSGNDQISAPNGFVSFFKWVGKSFVYGWKGFRSTLTSDIKSDILNLK